jgi:hypothetical protein
MNDTPRTDREAEINASGSDWDDFLHADFARDLERELAEAKREIERLDVAGIHTCHADCPRYACALKRERDQARAAACDQRKQLDKESPARLIFPWESTAIKP